MNLYKGLRSADAEIVLDLTKGQASFDYSLNKFQKGDSDSSCCLQAEGKYIYFLLRELRQIFLGFWLIMMILGQVALEFIQIVFIGVPKYQYTWQKILRSWEVFRRGVQEESIIGNQKVDTLKFLLKKNVWFEYNLDGDYSDKVQKISLLRRFIKKQHLGITSHQQDGWELIFDFESPPQHGYVSVRSLL